MSMTSQQISKLSATGLQILPLGPEHRDYLKKHIQEIWNGRFVISRGIAYEPAMLPGFIAMIATLKNWQHLMFQFLI